MISSLSGKLILKKEKFVVIDVNGVGYKVFLSQKALSKLPEIGANLNVFCFLDVKENALDLYGFLDQKELEFFEILDDIRGVGPKAAIEISSLGPLEKIKERILAQDEKLFDSISGIGRKKAMAIILELTGKIKNLETKRTKTGDEVEDGLANLGFARQDIKKTLEELPKDVKDPEQRIKLALKILGRQR